MPELPEVEITTRKLKPLLLGRKILDFSTDWPYGLRGLRYKEAAYDIKGRKVLSLARLGKVIVIYLSGNRLLAIHQKMSGKVLILPRGFNDKHIHYRFLLSATKGGRKEELVLHDVRKFAVVWYGTRKEILREKFFVKLGRDPLKLSFVEFKRILLAHKGILKPLLLRQDIFAGIGNIVADESLWKARLHPRYRVQMLKTDELRRLYIALLYILKKSIALGGTTMRNWRHPDLAAGGYYEKRYVYGREGLPCRRCGEVIRREVVGSRGTYLCVWCQKK
jgi:formamidopyrimidine-DNA glycosylase